MLRNVCISQEDHTSSQYHLQLFCESYYGDLISSRLHACMLILLSVMITDTHGSSRYSNQTANCDEREIVLGSEEFKKLAIGVCITDSMNMSQGFQNGMVMNYSSSNVFINLLIVGLCTYYFSCIKF